MKTTIVTSNRTIGTSGGVLMYGIKESHEGRYNQHNRRYSQRLYAAIDKCSSGLLDYTSNRVSNESNIYYCNLINDSLFSSPSSFRFSITRCQWPRMQALCRDVRVCWVPLDHDKVLSKSLPETLARVGRL